jgi:large repetitive protein
MPDTLINNTTSGDQYFPSTTRLADGSYVVVWDSALQDGSGTGVYARRFDATGTPIGNEFRVNTTTTGDQFVYVANVAALANGGFVVAWESADSSSLGIWAQRYDANGTTLGGEFRLNDRQTDRQDFVTLAARPGGGFVAAWQSQNHDVSGGLAVIGKIFNDDGSAAGGEFIVNATTAGSQVHQAVNVLPDGKFIVVYLNGLTNPPVYGRLFDASGAPLTGEIVISGTSSGYLPHTATLNDGSFVVTWDAPDANGLGSYVQHFAADFTAISAPQLVNTTTAGAQSNPRVAPLVNGGYVVMWESPDGSSDGMFVQRFSADDTRIGVETQVNQTTADIQVQPNVLTLADGSVLSLWSSNAQDGSGYGVFGRILATTNTAPTVTSSTHTSLGATTPFAATEFQSKFVDADSDALARIRIDSLPDDGTLQFNGAAVAAGQQISVRDLAKLAFTPTGVWDGHSSFQWSGSDGTVFASSPATMTITAQDPTNEFPINTYTSSDQNWPSAARLADGGYVIVWNSSGQDGSGLGVYGQRYDAAGLRIGGEFAVNTTTTSEQRAYVANVASLANGGFVIAWETQTNPSVVYERDIVAQRFDASGAKVGGQFQLNTFTTSQQDFVTIASRPGGGFVAAWQSVDQDGNNGGIIGRIFNENGSAAGNEFIINQTTLGRQVHQTINVLPDGKFVVVFLNDPAVYGRLFAADGTALTGDVVISNTSNGYLPHTATLADGSFVVTWDASDGNGTGSYVQHFSANLAALGAAQLVNTTTAGDQWSSRVVALTSGGYAVVWEGPDGSNDGIYAQRFSASDTKIGGEVHINSTTTNNQSLPNVLALNSDAFLALWTSAQQDGSGTGIYGRVIPVPTNTAPTVTDFDHTTFGGTTFFKLSEFTTAFADADADQLSAIRIDSLPTSGALMLNGSVVTAGQSVAASQIDHLMFIPGSNWGGVSNFSWSAYDGTTFSSTSAVTHITRTDPGQEFPINTYKVGDQNWPSAAKLADGGWVVVWNSINQDGSGLGVFAQRYNADGTRLGGEFSIATVTSGDQRTYVANVAALSNGGFVIAWETPTVGTSIPYEKEIVAQRFDSTGTKVGGQFQINTFTTGQQDFVTLASRPGGGFIASWQSVLQDGSDAGVIAKLFNEDGTPASGEFIVNVTTLGRQVHQSINVLPDGKFVIVYLNDPIVRAHLYEANGTSIKDVTISNTSNGYLPHAATLSDGSIVITWDDADGNGTGSYVQHFSSDLTPLGAAQLVNTTTTGNQTSARVAALSSGGYAVLWQGPDGSGGEDVYAQYFSATDVKVGGERHVNTTTVDTQGLPNVLSLDDGKLLALWTSHQQDGSGDGVYGRILTDGHETRVNTYTAGDQTWPSATKLSDGGYVVVWNSAGQDGSGLGVYGQRYDAVGLRIGGEFSIATATSGDQRTYVANVAALSNGGFVIAWETPTVGTSSPYEKEIVAQRFDSTGTKVGGQFQINTFTTGQQDFVTLASRPGGGFIASWQSVLQDGSDAGVIAKLFNEDGSAASGEFIVNTTTIGRQVHQSINVLSDGKFVIVYLNDPIVRAHLYEANGTSIKDVAISNTSNGYLPHAATLSDGSIVIAWDDGDGSGTGSYVQHFSADLTALGAAQLVNTTTTGDQSSARVTALSGGGYAIVWENAGGSAHDLAPTTSRSAARSGSIRRLPTIKPRRISSRSMTERSSRSGHRTRKTDRATASTNSILGRCSARPSASTLGCARPTRCRAQHALRRRRTLQQLLRRTDRPRHEIAAAIGAAVAEYVGRAIGAEGALVGADARLGRVRRQVAIATFAVGAQGQHEIFLAATVRQKFTAGRSPQGPHARRSRDNGGDRLWLGALAAAKFGNLGAVAAARHRAPAPVIRTRQIEKQQRATFRFASMDAIGLLATEQADRVLRQRRQQRACRPLHAHLSVAVELQGCNFARRNAIERVEGADRRRRTFDARRRERVNRLAQLLRRFEIVLQHARRCCREPRSNEPAAEIAGARQQLALSRLAPASQGRGQVQRHVTGAKAEPVARVGGRGCFGHGGAYPALRGTTRNLVDRLHGLHQKPAQPI